MEGRRVKVLGLFVCVCPCRKEGLAKVTKLILSFASPGFVVVVVVVVVALLCCCQSFGFVFLEKKKKSFAFFSSAFFFFFFLSEKFIRSGTKLATFLFLSKLKMKKDQ